MSIVFDEAKDKMKNKALAAILVTSEGVVCASLDFI